MDINYDKIIVGDNFVSFAVDGELPFTGENLETFNSSELVDSILYDNDIKAEGHITSSFEDKELCYLDRDPFFQSFVTAYCEHRPLILSPDMIWLKILQELNLYIGLDPQTALISHQRQLNLGNQHILSSLMRSTKLVKKIIY